MIKATHIALLVALTIPSISIGAEFGKSGHIRFADDTNNQSWHDTQVDRYNSIPKTIEEPSARVYSRPAIMNEIPKDVRPGKHDALRW